MMLTNKLANIEKNGKMRAFIGVFVVKTAKFYRKYTTFKKR
jgi:hypothetical protein